MSQGLAVKKKSYRPQVKNCDSHFSIEIGTKVSKLIEGYFFFGENDGRSFLSNWSDFLKADISIYLPSGSSDSAKPGSADGASCPYRWIDRSVDRRVSFNPFNFADFQILKPILICLQIYIEILCWQLTFWQALSYPARFT